MPSTPFDDPTGRCSRRRALAALGGGLLAGLAGCGDLASDDGARPKALSLSLNAFASPFSELVLVDLAETEPDWDEDAFTAAVDGEVYETTHQTPFPTSHPESPEYVEHEGTYYRLGHVVVGEERVRHPVLRLYDVGEDSDLDETPAHVGSHELPRVDVRAVKRASLAARARGNMGGVPWRIVERGGSVYRDPDAVESSELLADDGPNHVGHLGRVYRVETAVERFDETVYRADVDAVADSEATFREVVDARYLDARLSEKELSAAQRDILTEAEAGDYRAKHPYPEPLRELLKAMGRRAYLDGNISKDSVDPEEFGHGLVKIDESYLRFDIALYTPTE